jgi:hypothetical protein
MAPHLASKQATCVSDLQTSLTEIACSQNNDDCMKEFKAKGETDDDQPNRIGWEVQQNVLYRTVPVKGEGKSINWLCLRNLSLSSFITYTTERKWLVCRLKGETSGNMSKSAASVSNTKLSTANLLVSRNLQSKRRLAT